MSTRVDCIHSEKTANKLFSCSVHEIAAKTGELNKLLDAGWLVEDQMVVSDMYVVLLKQEGEPRKVIYVDVGNVPPTEVVEYIERTKELLSAKGKDLYVPVRG